VRQVMPDRDEWKVVKARGRVVAQLVGHAGREVGGPIPASPLVHWRHRFPQHAFDVDTPTYDDPRTANRGEPSQLRASVSRVACLGTRDEATL
jgi:hypothetical protein